MENQIAYERIASRNDFNRLELLFHYTSLYTALEKILFQKKIRMSRLDKLNDPKESRPIFQFSRSRINSLFESDNIIGIYNHFMTSTKLLCFTIDSVKYIKRTETNPFSGKGFNHPRMWAQYGDNHRGLCLVFDREKIIEKMKIITKNERLLEGKVSYSEKYLDNLMADEDPYEIDLKMIGKIGIDKYYIKHSKLNKRVYFFNKHSDWKDESEYRLVLLDNNPDDRLIEYGDSLIAVICGSEFPLSYLATLKNLCKALNIDAFQIVWEKGFSKDLKLLYEWSEDKYD